MNEVDIPETLERYRGYNPAFWNRIQRARRAAKQEIEKAEAMRLLNEGGAMTPRQRALASMGEQRRGAVRRKYDEFISIETRKKLIHGAPLPPESVRPGDLLEWCADYHKTDMEGVLAVSRGSIYVVVRHHAIWLCKQRTGWSINRLTQFFSMDRDAVRNALIKLGDPDVKPRRRSRAKPPVVQGNPGRDEDLAAWASVGLRNPAQPAECRERDPGLPGHLLPPRRLVA